VDIFNICDAIFFTRGTIAYLHKVCTISATKMYCYLASSCQSETRNVVRKVESKRTQPLSTYFKALWCEYIIAKVVWFWATIHYLCSFFTDSGYSGVVVEYRTRNQEVADSTHTRSTASNLEQAANLLCAQALQLKASYPQRDGKWVVAAATGWRPSVADWGDGVSASCTVGPILRQRGQWMAT